MSAIFGSVAPEEGLRVYDNRVDEALSYYGPNGFGAWRDRDVHLRHYQLFTTPESFSEDQPRSSNTLALTASVRLDNREELRPHLGLSISDPDDLYIFRAYRKWGTDCARYLLGDFAFAVWDQAEHSLFCARDALGVSPFFYFTEGSRFVFSSDIKGVLAHPDVADDYDLEFLTHYLTSRYYRRASRTFFRRIRKLPPGHDLLFQQDSLRLRRYWSPETLPESNSSIGNCRDRLDELLRRAISCRLRSSGPVGAHLSGGLDSSSIAVIAGRELAGSGSRLPTFSWSPPPSGPLSLDDERRRILDVCEAERLECRFSRYFLHHERSVLTRDVAREPTTMMQFEEPIQATAAEEGVRVLLSGWGGDEFVTFNGRGVLSRYFVRGSWMTMLRECYLTGKRAESLPKALLLNAVLVPIIPDPFYRWRYLSTLEDRTYLHPNLERYKKPPLLLRERVGSRPNMLALLQLGHLSQRMEAWAAAGARYNLVYRYPLLDRRLVEFAFSLQPRCWRNQGYSRYLYRLVAERYLPKNLVWGRPKRELSVFSRWRHPQDAGPDDYFEEVKRRAAENPFVDGERLLADQDKPEDQGRLRGRALEMLFLKL